MRDVLEANNSRRNFEEKLGSICPPSDLLIHWLRSAGFGPAWGVNPGAVWPLCRGVSLLVSASLAPGGGFWGGFQEASRQQQLR